MDEGEKMVCGTSGQTVVCETNDDVSEEEQSSPQHFCEFGEGEGDGVGWLVDNAGDGGEESGGVHRPLNCVGVHAHEPTSTELINEYEVEQSAWNHPY